jgi:hypothetical protein
MLSHTLLLAGLGFGLALGLALAIRPVLEHIAPQIALTYLPTHVLALGIWTPVIASLAALPPVRVVTRVDPCLVFRE